MGDPNSETAQASALDAFDTTPFVGYCLDGNEQMYNGVRFRGNGAADPEQCAALCLNLPAPGLEGLAVDLYNSECVCSYAGVAPEVPNSQFIAITVNNPSFHGSGPVSGGSQHPTLSCYPVLSTSSNAQTPLVLDAFEPPRDGRCFDENEQAYNRVTFSFVEATDAEECASFCLDLPATGFIGFFLFWPDPSEPFPRSCHCLYTGVAPEGPPSTSQYFVHMSNDHYGTGPVSSTDGSSDASCYPITPPALDAFDPPLVGQCLDGNDKQYRKVQFRGSEVQIPDAEACAVLCLNLPAPGLVGLGFVSYARSPILQAICFCSYSGVTPEEPFDSVPSTDYNEVIITGDLPDGMEFEWGVGPVSGSSGSSNFGSCYPF